MHDDERAAGKNAADLIEREHERRSSRLWPRCLLTLPYASSWPPRAGTSWARFAFSLGTTRTSHDDAGEIRHVLVTHAWGIVRHEASLAAAPTFEVLGDELVVDGDADVSEAAATSASTPSVGALLLRAVAGELTPSEEKRLAGAYLANADRTAFSLPRAARDAHREHLAWLDRWRGEKPLWVGHDPGDLFADPIADRLAAAEAKEKRAAADLDAELAALKAKL